MGSKSAGFPPMALPSRTEYNAEMGAKFAAVVDAWLSAGGLVVASSDRAARANAAAFHRARRDEGRRAWNSPRILDWQTFVRSAWEERSIGDRLALNSLQEQWLWMEVIARIGNSAGLLENSRRRLASLAMNAHALLCSYAPRFLESKARASWQEDAAEFSTWLFEFDTACREQLVLSSHHLPLELYPVLESDGATRPPLLLVGFDRLLPVQEQIFNAWGQWRHATPDDPAPWIRYSYAPDAHFELNACAAWCRQRLADHPGNRILVITQSAADHRGEIERTFLHFATDPAFRFEFSLGVPLAEIAIARSAQMILHWLDGALHENEIDWLLSTGYATATLQETGSIQASVRTLRRKSLQRTHWSLQTFVHQKSSSLPSPWVERMAAAQRHLAAYAQRDRSPLEWSEVVPQLLETIGWPGARSLSSAEYQAARRWNQLVETCGSLGFSGHRTSWRTFLSELRSAMEDTLFAPESEDAPILIAGPAESAGLTADAVWLLGADEDAWPARGDMNPLLPIDVQRDYAMPHASPQLDWNLAHAITTRLIASSPEVQFSYGHQVDGVDMRASRLVLQLAGAPQPLPAELTTTLIEPLLTVPVDDLSLVRYTPASNGEDAVHARPRAIRGGSTVLTAQSQCPFMAFAKTRLSADDWEPAEAGLSAAERGQLLHATLHAVWDGPPHGIHTLEELKAIPNLLDFSAGHVHVVMESKIPARARQQMPARYLELEEQRLTRLVAEWLEYERTRISFTVAGTEINASPNIAGLPLQIRLDRLDRLHDGSFLVIDYKTGNITPKVWDLPRPEDVQLPLYAGFALASDQPVGGLAFARVRPGQLCFAGRVGDPESTLFSGLPRTSSLAREKFEAEQLIDWRENIEQLARDFLSGRADVDPRDPVQTCKRCGLHTLCRIHEREVLCDDSDAESEVIDG
jgi:probable DNA repair protein